jgi:16S rRNA (cytidine1402-2'-O)-methyltransferase
MNENATDKSTAERRIPCALVIDDEADLRELLSLTLVRLGLDVDGAESVTQARDMLARKRYTLALTDMRMPDGTGLELVREVVQLGLHVTTLPGASSVLSALCLSALPTDRVLFAGFLPPKKEAALTELRALAATPATLVFFESARRLLQTLPLLREVLGNRQVAVVRELTKLFEEARRGALDELITHYEKEGEPKGEVVIVVGPPDKQEGLSEEEINRQLALLLREQSVKEAAAIMAEQTGRPRKELYALALKLAE